MKEISDDRKVCIDLFSGEEGFSAAFADSDDWQVVTVEIEERFNPDICADIFDLRPSDLPDADVVLASPPCTAFSMAASGSHIDENGNPTSDWGADSLALTHHVIGLIEGINPDWHFVENPMGGMRKVLGDPDAHVWWCQYGSDRAKPTDLWGEIPPGFHERSCKNKNSSCHHEKAPRGADSGTQSKDRDPSERAKIPYGLSEEILNAVENPGTIEKSVVEADW